MSSIRLFSSILFAITIIMINNYHVALGQSKGYGGGDAVGKLPVGKLPKSYSNHSRSHNSSSNCIMDPEKLAELIRKNANASALDDLLKRVHILHVFNDIHNAMGNRTTKKP